MPKYNVWIDKQSSDKILEWCKKHNKTKSEALRGALIAYIDGKLIPK